MAGFQKVAQLMDDDVLHAPFRQQQQVGREADGLVLEVAHAPARDGGFVVDQQGLHAHDFGVAFHHGLDECFQLAQRIVGLLLGTERQLVVEVAAFLLTLISLLARLFNPVAVLFNKSLYYGLGQSDGSRDVDVAILGNSH